MKYIIGGILGLMLGGGIEMQLAASFYRDQIAYAYGCARHDAGRTPNSDPAEYENPTCEAYRALWLRGEQWPAAR